MLYMIILCLFLMFIQFLREINLNSENLGQISTLKKEIKNQQKLINDLKDDINILNYKLKYKE